MRRNIFLILLLAVMVSATGCETDPPEPTDFERSYLHVISAAQVSNFDLAFDYWNTEGQVIPDFDYNRNWPLGGYANLVAGGQPDEFGNGKLYVLATRQPFINVPIDTVMQPTPIILAPQAYATLVIVDSAGTLAIDLFEDNYDAPGGEVNLRLINLKDGSGNVGLRSTDGSINLSNVGYRTASDFIRVPAGVYDMEVVDESGATVLTIWNARNLGAGVTYSFYLSGSGSSDLSMYSH